MSASLAPRQRAFAYRHIVGFAETNLVGNVYFAHHLAWQGRCRELFLREHAPDVLRQLYDELALVTLNCSCQYYGELTAADAVDVEMRLGSVVGNRMTLVFEYRTGAGPTARTVAAGEQTIACMKREDGAIRPADWPSSLLRALEPFRIDARS